jgi:small subunit ribosomal protein S1
MSWDRVKHPSECFSIGNKVTAKILSLDLKKEQVTLGIKQLQDDPWKNIGEQYGVSKEITGTVINHTN